MKTSKDESKIIIAFTGLFFFRRKKEGDPYTVGVLRGVPNHSLSLRVSGETGDIALSEFMTDQFRDWDLSVVNDVLGAETKNPRPRHIGGKEFDRTDLKRDASDYRWIVNFNELYPGEKLVVFEDVLSPIVNVNSGELFTLCRTAPMKFKKGIQEGDFGGMADITGVEIDLEANESLVLRTRNGGRDIIKPLPYEAGMTRCLAFLNLPEEHKHDGSEDNDHGHGHQNGHEIRTRRPSTHFQNYYLLIPKPFNERVQLDLAARHQRCKLPPELDELLGTDSLRDETPKDAELLTPPPDYCGTSGGGS